MSPCTHPQTTHPKTICAAWFESLCCVAQSNFTVFKGTPPGAIIGSAFGKTFPAPPNVNFGSIVAAGQGGG